MHEMLKRATTIVMTIWRSLSLFRQFQEAVVKTGDAQENEVPNDLML